MESERRHELQTNALAGYLSRAPELFREHGSKVMLVIIIALLATILLYQRSRKSNEQLQVGWTNIAAARMSIEQLAASPRVGQGMPAEQINLRQQLANNVNGALNSILAAGDRQLAAEANLLRGDLNWTLANLPEIPGAATRPALRMPSATSEYLTVAEESYRRVTNTYSDQKFSVAAARFGLAAIAENRGQWEIAATMYKSVKDDSNTITAYKALADRQLAAIDVVRSAIYLVPTTQPASSPTTRTN